MAMNFFFTGPYRAFRLDLIKEKINRISPIKKSFAVAVWFLAVESGWFPHKQREFQCKDSTLSLKYQGDTVSTIVLILSTFMPLFLLWLAESILAKPAGTKLSRTRISLKRAFHWFKKYYVCVIMSLALVEALKVIVGGLRPHFFDTCRPNVLDYCNEGQLIQRYYCTNKDDSRAFVRDTQKSFPSGHSTLSFLEAIFLAWYLQKRIPKFKSLFFIPLLQTLCLCWAFFCSLSRITDHRHHWYDVLVGSIIGILFAIFCCKVSCKSFTNSNMSSLNPESPPLQKGISSRTSLRNGEDTSLNTV
ncbi:Phospholipid phosphatase [Sergentomyia squamirostris]